MEGKQMLEEGRGARDGEGNKNKERKEEYLWKIGAAGEPFAQEPLRVESFTVWEFEFGWQRRSEGHTWAKHWQVPYCILKMIKL